MAEQAAIQAQLAETARGMYGPERAQQLGTRIADLARWLALIEQQPLDLLDGEPDHSDA